MRYYRIGEARRDVGGEKGEWGKVDRDMSEERGM